MTRPVLIVVSGDRNSGKTSWVCSLVAALQSRGFRVGTVKHTHHDYAVVGKDSTRHQESGAQRVALIAPHGGAIYDRWPDEPPLTDVVDQYFAGFDIVVAEGYRDSDHPKIVVGPESRANAENVLARVSEAQGEAPPDELDRVVQLVVSEIGFS